MSFPFEYDHIEGLVFGGTLPTRATFDTSSVVTLPLYEDTYSILAA